MPKAEPDLFLEALAAIPGRDRGGAKMLLPELCTPTQLEAIRQARQVRKLSFNQIAKALAAGKIVVSASTVQNWLRSEGIE